MQMLKDPLIVLQEVKLLSGNIIVCLPQYSVLIPAFWSLLRMQKLAYINNMTWCVVGNRVNLIWLYPLPHYHSNKNFEIAVRYNWKNKHIFLKKQREMKVLFVHIVIIKQLALTIIKLHFHQSEFSWAKWVKKGRLLSYATGRIFNWLKNFTRHPLVHKFSTGQEFVWYCMNVTCEQRPHFCCVSWHMKSSLCQQPFNFLSCMREICHVICKQN